MYTASTALLEALQETGVSFLFANLGSDHPALIEALAEGRARGARLPQVITCPNEMVALSSAHGFAQLSGQAQAVIVHVECGTQALGGAVHNAARGRVPVFIFAGLSPMTQQGELRGSRNEFIQWIQDVHDQRGIVREYMKYDNEFRTAKNVKAIVRRAMQFAHSDPKGPVYLVGAREVMEEECEPIETSIAPCRALSPAALPAELVAEIVTALEQARRPLIVTSYVGRKPEAVGELQRLARTLGIGVLESVPNFMNYPHDDDMYVGSQWNQPQQNAALADADVVLVIDSDVPWIPTVSRPADGTVIFHIDADPLKVSMPLWYIDTLRSCQADATTALAQMNASLRGRTRDAGAIAERSRHYSELHKARLERLRSAERPDPEVITSEHLTASLRCAIGSDAVVMNEGITNYSVICDHVAPTQPGCFFNSGGGSLGWNGGAAIGAKLARPDKLIVALSGDGSYLFCVPSSVHWMARRYKTPFLQVIYNNGGWQAPRFSALAVHPSGYASRSDDLGLSFDPEPDYAGIAAAAGGAFARKVTQPGELDEAIAAALHAVQVEGRAAVLDVALSRR